MIILADFFGVFVAALSGALLAARKEMDIYGFLILGLATGIGGGTLRDVILDVPVFWVENQLYLIVGLAAGGLAFVFARQAMNGWRSKMILWLDALALSFFAATGAMKALTLGAGPLVVVTMAFMTSAAGGLLRDMMAQERPFIFGGEIYATAAVFGGTSLVIADSLNLPEIWLLPIAMIAAFSLRSAAIVFGWQLSVRRRSD